MKKWEKITKSNIKELKEGDVVRYHDGYDWNERPISQRYIDMGFIPTGCHNETANLLYPMFGDGVFVLRKTTS